MDNVSSLPKTCDIDFAMTASKVAVVRGESSLSSGLCLLSNLSFSLGEVLSSDLELSSLFFSSMLLLFTLLGVEDIPGLAERSICIDTAVAWGGGDEGGGGNLQSLFLSWTTECLSGELE